MSSRLRALSVLIAVFLSGAVIGGAITYLWLGNHFASRPFADRIFARSRHKLPELLQLSPGQETRFREIMDESRQKYVAAWNESTPRFGAIRSEMHAKILAILDEEQKKNFQAFLKEAEARRGTRLGDRGWPPRGGPPFPIRTSP